MLHIVRMIQDRYPRHAHRALAVLLSISLLVLLAGLALFMARNP